VVLPGHPTPHRQLEKGMIKYLVSLAHRMARWHRYLFARRVAVDPGTVLGFSGRQTRTMIITIKKGY
jgi:hypothetical protein